MELILRYIMSEMDVEKPELMYTRKKKEIGWEKVKFKRKKVEFE